MNFAIRYLTEYDYDAEVLDNLNALRVKPASGSRQRCDEFSVRLTPEVRPHRHLTIDVRARVSTQPYIQAPPSMWEALGDPAYREAGGEFLLQTDDAPGDAVLAELIGETRRSGSPIDTVMLVSQLIPDRFEYRRGATFVDSSIADLLHAGAGVCLLRHHGIAARYVSGYLFAGGSDDLRESVEVDTHAWLEALLPGAEGSDPIWVGVDPTNRVRAGEPHVKIGHGRHYADVPPIKGVYRGQASATLNASVTMTRVERADPASISRS